MAVPSNARLFSPALWGVQVFEPEATPDLEGEGAEQGVAQPLQHQQVDATQIALPGLEHLDSMPEAPQPRAQSEEQQGEIGSAPVILLFDQPTKQNLHVPRRWTGARSSHAHLLAQPYPNPFVTQRLNRL